MINTIVYLLLTSVLLIVSGIKRVPGIGILFSIIIIAIAYWNNDIFFVQKLFEYPSNWFYTLFIGFLLASIISLLSFVLIGPYIERITNQPHNLKAIEHIRNNWKSTIIYILIGWGMGGFIEEIIFRGFLMSAFKDVLGTSNFSLLINIAITSILFGMAHWYQGKSGALSTGIISIFLGLIFIYNQFNLWLPIIVHGFIDTISIFIISLGYDKKLVKLIQKQL